MRNTIDSGRAKQELVGKIDHTDLRKELSYADVEKLCLEAHTYGFAAVVVHSINVPLAVDCLSGSSVKASSVIGFPFGGQVLEVKLSEASLAKEQGVGELEMVLNSAAIRAGQWKEVEHEMRSFRDVAGALVAKVILESMYLTEEEKKLTCQLARDVGMDFVVNSTGFRIVSTDPQSVGQASSKDICLMKEVAGPQLSVKAQGGIRTYGDALAMIKVGASRIGTDAGVAIYHSSLRKK